MSRGLLAISWRLVVFLVPVVFQSQEVRGAALYSVSGNITTLPYMQGYTSGCDRVVRGIRVEVWEDNWVSDDLLGATFTERSVGSFYVAFSHNHSPDILCSSPKRLPLRSIYHIGC